MQLIRNSYFRYRRYSAYSEKPQRIYIAAWERVYFFIVLCTTYSTCLVITWLTGIPVNHVITRHAV